MLSPEQLATIDAIRAARPRRRKIPPSQRSKRELPETVELRIVRAYQDGVDMRSLIQRFGIPLARIRAVLAKHGARRQG